MFLPNLLLIILRGIIFFYYYIALSWDTFDTLCLDNFYLNEDLLEGCI